MALAKLADHIRLGTDDIKTVISAGDSLQLTGPPRRGGRVVRHICAAPAGAQISTEVERRKLGRVSLFGTSATMQTKLFGALQHAEVITPAPHEVDIIGKIYTKITENSAASEEVYSQLRSLAQTIIDREKVEAIILAGTDLALVFNPANTDFPHIDGARLHIEAIMRDITS